ncbi:NAD-dependent epimerase/dehydratase family protein [Mycolicibacterium arseniciresistens]|uniref:NAD-dependent epimerase/dehydratase family protein n=1 Tax=Mycolicibacterium arseniciresistens TaxID=3062257 RepID=A0ABT8UAF2_9MYCO|nr:NAD-dependent epimerase/dehydratase family protein [Mycolicibacterium arseniciresistens]MDO3634151.1 NAD-dependent epimerase/dehydratase family protein [Mycolicibacterium arseniciresistens]
MLCLVTGGTGFVGSHTVRALRADGHDVRLLVRDCAKAERVYGTGRLGEVIVGDVTDPAAVDTALSGVDAVVHCAAVVATDVSPRTHRGREMHTVNVRSTELVIGGAVHRGIDAIVYLSSQTALFTPGAPIDARSEPAVARGAYARSKAAGDSYVRALQDDGAPVTTLYPPGVIGPDDPGLSEGNRAVRGFVSQLVPDTTSGYEVIDVRDLAALISASAFDGRPGRRVVNGHFLRWCELIALFDDLTGRRVRRMRLNGAFLRALGRAADRVPLHLPLSAETMELATAWPATSAPGTGSPGPALRDVRSSYADTIRWLHRTGRITRRQAGALAS